jgi:hypothetical protein
VEAVVKAQKDDQSEQEIGRFGIFPSTGFTAADSSGGARRFGLPLPKELAGSKALRLDVYLVRSRGGGEGAVLELGGAAIR